MWKFFERKSDSTADSPRVVASMPPAFADSLRAAAPGLAATYDTLDALVRSARASIKIFSPYVDPTVTALLAGAQVPVSFVTTARDGRRATPSPVLERLAGSRGVVVRYLVERANGAQMYQMHAKLLLVDSRVAYVGSANLTDTSLHYNLELGVIVDAPDAVRTLDALFDRVFGHLAVPAKLL